MLKGFFNNGDIQFSENWKTSSENDLNVFFRGRLFMKELTQNPCADPAGTIMSLYKTSGISQLRDLDGTFLLIIRDGKKLFFLRDRFGSGEQLYFNNKGFSSSVKELLALTDMSPDPDWDRISGFLQFGYIPAPATALKGVSKLPSGVLMSWEGNNPTLTGLFHASDYHAEKTINISSQEAIETYKSLHQKAILKRIAGAENVGVLLSGGYDSAGNIAALSQIHSGKVQAFSIGFKDNPWSEVPLARQMADRIGADFHQYEIDGSELNDVPLLINKLGDPFQEGGVMVNFAAMKLASGFKPDVVLGGDGNDQHHGTFAKELALNHFVRRTGMGFLQKAFYNFTNKETDAKDNNLFRIGFHNRKILNILYMDAFGFSKGELKANGLKNPLLSDYGLPVGMRQSKDFDEFYFQRQYLVDVRHVINEIILFKAGQNAALRGINIAFPYMDNEVADFLAALPRNLRFEGSYTDFLKGRGKSKVVHKKLYASAMPDALSAKKKQGGFAPLPLFFQSKANQDLAEKVILQSGMVKSGLNEEWITQFISRYKSESQRTPNWFWYSQLQAFKFFNLLVLAVWWEHIINNRKADKLEELI